MDRLSYKIAYCSLMHEALCDKIPCGKSLSIAVEEVYEGKVKIIGDEEEQDA